MLKALYTLPKFFLVSLLIGGGIVFILINDPPHSFCDSQIEQFKKLQTGILYKDPKDFRKEKSSLTRKQNLCRQENAPGSCYDYFLELKKVLKDLKLLSEECSSRIYSTSKLKKTLSSALTLMTALAWREEVLTGRVSKHNWITPSDLYLFCDLKRKYISHYGEENFLALESQILSRLPRKEKTAPQIVKKRTILSENCQKYR